MNSTHCIRFSLFLLLFIPIRGQASERVPFRLAGNLLLVQATVNGSSGNFILDTGAPELIVNRAYFEGVDVPWAQMDVVDIRGHASPANCFVIKDFAIGGLSLNPQYALSIDLSSLERTKGIRLLGIIGYSVLKDLELFLDFDYGELQLTRIRNKKSTSRADVHHPMVVFDLRMSHHIPYVVARAGNKKLRLGIDTGAEVNVLGVEPNKKAKVEMSGPRAVQVKGISAKKQTALSGVMTGVSVDGYGLGPLQVTVLDIRPINENLSMSLDGLLGIPFLKRGKVSINYKRHELCVWPSDGNLANQDWDEDIEVNQ